MLLVGIGLVVGTALAMPIRSRLAEEPPPTAPASAVAPPVKAIAILPEPSRTPDPPPEPPPEPHRPAGDDPTPEAPSGLEDVVARVVPAVASIEAGRARGTGFFVAPDTLITNAHVVEGQTSVRLRVGALEQIARVATVSASSDLAILRVFPANPGQATLRLGSASRARVGQEVVAVGSALGVLPNTVTRGIVSAVRQVGPITLVQTDAAINPGNSGGPLVDRDGMVIGVNSMAVAGHAGSGLAFAVAIDHAARLLAGGGDTGGAETPLRGLEQLLEKPTGSDDLRARGEQTYAQALANAARQADQIDTYWQRYAKACVVSALPGDRPWFGVYGAGGIRINATSAYDCGGWLETLHGHAQTLRQTVETADDVARRSGVYPGVMRQLRQQYRLTWR